MDIAYRLAGETDMHGMLGDVKRAIAWLKTNHASLGVDPAKVVLAGGSAGAHLALLAAYTPNTPGFDPEDTRECDTSACAVVAFYPVADLRTLTVYWSEQAMHPLATALGKALGLFPQQGYLPWSRLARRLFGGPLGAISRELLTYSPVAHVGPHCPPTLILQGLHDHVVPVEDVLPCMQRWSGRVARQRSYRCPWSNTRLTCYRSGCRRRDRPRSAPSIASVPDTLTTCRPDRLFP